MAANNSYVRPHSEIYQFLDRTLSSTGNHISACVVGAQYDLYRRGKEVTEGITPDFTSTTQDIPLLFSVDPINEYRVDTETVSVYGEDLFIKMPYTAVAGSGFAVTPDAAGGNLFKVSFRQSTTGSSTVIVAGQGLATEFGGCSVRVGDILLIFADTEQSGIYEYFTATVKELIKTSDSSTGFDGAVLDVPVFAGDASATFELRAVLRKYTGPVSLDAITPVRYDSADGKWKAKVSSSLTLAAGKDDGTDATVTIADASTAFGLAQFGSLYPTYRVLVTPPADDEVIELRSVPDVQDKLGTIAVGNEIAYAANEARRGAAGRPVYAVRVRHTGAGNDLTVEDFLEAMRKTDSNDYTYVFVPVVDGTGKYDNEIMRAVADFNNDKSQPEVQMWRQSYFGIDLSGDTTLKFISANPEGSVTVVSNGDVIRIVSAPGSTSFRRVNFRGMDDTLRSGDRIDLGASGVYTVRNVLSDVMVQLTSVVTLGSGGGTIAGIIRPESSSAKGLAATALADALSDRRCKVVWTDSGTYNGEIISNAYIAAFVAGLRSAVQPNRSLTNSEVETISACPAMYTRYTIADLDNVAKHGVTIVTQDTKFDAPHIRHDLTTDTVNGLLYSESSVTTNVDNISYAVKDVIRSFYGKTNVTPSALEQLQIRIGNVLNRFTLDSKDSLIGPSLIKYENLTVTQDPDMKDRVVVRVNYFVPSPMNVVQVFQMVYLADITIAQAA